MSGAREWLAPVLVSAGVLAASAGCDHPPADASGGQWYRAGLETEEGEQVPFFLRLPGDCHSDAATIVNGGEQIRADCFRSPVGFVVDFPVYGTLLEAWFKPDGTIVGHWCREWSTGREPILALTAKPVAEPDPRVRFLAEPDAAEDRAEVAGRWRMEFEEYGVAQGVFLQDSAGVLTGTVEVPSEYGDMRFLAGNVHGTRVRLSTFDGRHAYALEGEIQPDGTMEGDLVLGGVRDPFVAERDDDFDLPDPLARVAFAPDVSRLELEPLREPKFDGKGVIVQLFGTWCPNCNDHAPLLVELYESYRARGLEILALAYEYGEDPEYNTRRVHEFKKKHGVEWDIVISDSTLEDLARDGLAGLAPIEGVPVTIFLNRDRTVHAIYSGFSGPATGDAHRETKARFEQLTAEILGAPLAQGRRHAGAEAASPKAP